jgi:magnesium transporter
MNQIADHILTLQHSLAYYERMLSDWNPTYTAQLGAEVSIAKNKADINLLYLTTVAACCTTNLILIGRLTAFLYTNLLKLDSFSSGVFSMNVNIPRNLRAAGHPFFWFIGVICMSILITCTLLSLVRHWWKQSKRRRFVR